MKKSHLLSTSVRNYVPGRRYHGVQGKVVQWVEHSTFCSQTTSHIQSSGCCLSATRDQMRRLRHSSCVVWTVGMR